MILMSSSLVSFIKECKYTSGFNTDHSFVECTLIKPDNDDSRGPGLWKFNVLHLKDPGCIFKINNVIDRSRIKYQCCDSDIKWEMIKCEIVQAIIDYAKRKAKHQEIHLNKLYEE